MRHLFVCTNTTPGGKPACGRRGGPEVIAAVQKQLLATGVAASVTSCGCLGSCFDGPNAVVYPDGVWYGGLAVDDASALADHLSTGVIYEAKQSAPPGRDDDTST